MNRNVESHFSQLPMIDIERSIFDRSSTHKTSFNVGDLIPFYIDEVLPGDSFRVTTSKVVRLQTLLTPIMDNMYLDTYFFYVPNRLVWKHWKEFMGENTESAWLPSTEYTPPLISSPEGGFAVGTVADYLGIPPNLNFSSSDPQCPIALPFRAYALICNEFFRDENLTDPLNIPLGDANQSGSNGTDYVNDVANGGMPFKVAKYHDYFTSCLPSPQKGADVTFPLINQKKYAPVNAQNFRNLVVGNTWSAPLQMAGVGEGTVVDPTGAYLVGMNGTYVTHLSTEDPHVNAYLTPVNLWADLSNSVGSVTINQLRLAFQLQKFYERCARGGTRYIEMLKSHFGVTSPDARLQRPEYLGGNRISLAVHEVTNSAQSQSDFLGDLGAKSVTSDIHEDFEKSFTEHGYVIGVCCVRYDHSYPQGIERFWKRKSITDFYWPVFANVGEQPVYRDELYANRYSMANRYVFGYQEAWAEYRYKPNRISSEMRPGVTNSLASWHLADYYTSYPTLSDSWIRESKSNVDRVLAVTSANANQVFCDIYVQNIATRPMPVYSIPGLIDHH